MAVPEVKVVETPRGTVSFAEKGSGRPVIILHSLLTDRGAFDGVADGIGGRVITPDLPGFGRTTPEPPEIEAYASAMAELVTELSLADEDVVLIGNGLGAFVSLAALIHHGELFSRAILVGAGTGFPEPAKEGFTKMIDAARSGGMEAVTPIALLRIFTEEYLAQNPDMAEERADVLNRTNPVAFITACQALRRFDCSALAGTIDTPTMIVVGDEDRATPPEFAIDLDSRVPHSTLVRLPGLAHAPQLQDPEAFVTAVRPFLEEK